MSRCRRSATASGSPSRTLQWVISGYLLTYGGLLLLGGRAGDLLGHRRLLITLMRQISGSGTAQT
jgi:MFS family permease